MTRWTLLIVYLIAGAVHAQGGLPRWAGLPAMDVQHLHGPYAGRTVCPMCAHGYDAGVLVFLPAATPALQAGRVAAVLRQTTAALAAGRFRTFLVLTGGPPSTALPEAARGPAAGWHVGQLQGAALADAAAAFDIDLQRRGYGIVFAQRRLLWAFDPGVDPALWQAPLARHAAHALDFLRATYADPVASADPDTPKGRLWLAPNRLQSRLALAEGDTGQACFFDAVRGRRSDALVALHAAGPAGSAAAIGKTGWARTDAHGCLTIQGFQDQGWLEAEIFSALSPVATVRFPSSALVANRRTRLSLDPTIPGVTGREPVAGSCDGCEAVFQGLPTTTPAVARLVAADHPGEPLRLSGTVYDGDGRPAPGIVVYAYQTDHTGQYPADRRLTGAAARHGGLRAWARSDADGRYGFLSIRPGAYADGSEPGHIHMHVIEPGRCTYYLGDVLFTDDPRLDADQRQRQRRAPGGSGIVRPVRDPAGGWAVTRDIRLRQHVAGAEVCAEGR